MNRGQVYTLINGEREYQTEKWGPIHEEKTGIKSFINYIRFYAENADKTWLLDHNEDLAMSEIRKVAALAVAAMEKFGAPER